MLHRVVVIFTVLFFGIVFTITTASATTWKAAYGEVPVYKHHKPGAENPNNPKIATIKSGEIVKELDRYNFWIKVNVDDKTGWTSKANLEKIAGENKPILNVGTFKTNYDSATAKYVSKVIINNAGEASQEDVYQVTLYRNETPIKDKLYYDGVPVDGYREKIIKTKQKPTRVEVDY